MVMNDPLPTNQLIQTIVVSKSYRGEGIFFFVVVVIVVGGGGGGTITAATASEGGGVRVIAFGIVAAVDDAEDPSAR